VHEANGDKYTGEWHQNKRHGNIPRPSFHRTARSVHNRHLSLTPRSLLVFVFSQHHVAPQVKARALTSTAVSMKATGPVVSDM
jgi:hypothetical protein